MTEDGKVILTENNRSIWRDRGSIWFTGSMLNCLAYYRLTPGADFGKDATTNHLDFSSLTGVVQGDGFIAGGLGASGSHPYMSKSSFAYASAITSGGALTIRYWFQITNVDPAYVDFKTDMFIFTSNGLFVECGFIPRVIIGTVYRPWIKIGRGSPASVVELESTSTISLNEWHDAVVTYTRSSGAFQFFLDGVRVFNSTCLSGLGQDFATLDFAASNFGWTGFFDEVGFWPFLWTAQQASDDFYDPKTFP